MTNLRYADALSEGKALRLRARTVLSAGRRVLMNQGGEEALDAVQSIDAVLERDSVAAEDAEGLAKQLEILKGALADSVVAEAVKTRGGPKTVGEIGPLVDALRGADQATAAPRGTPVETEQLDLIDGLIVSLARSARDAAEAAVKNLGEPALAAAFELNQLYRSGRRKK